MKSWPGLVAALYFILVALLAFILLFICIPRESKNPADFLPFVVGVAAVLTAAQVTLLLVPVDLTRERPVSRRKLLVPVIVTGILSSLLMLGGLGCLFLAIFSDKSSNAPDPLVIQLAPLPFLWGVWGWVFYLYFKVRDPQAVVARLMTGLLRGSILELLVAIPSHVIARRRDDCCAPAATYMGIVTGLALMLMSFGPGVLYLFARRLRDLRRAQEIPRPDTNL